MRPQFLSTLLISGAFGLLAASTSAQSAPSYSLTFVGPADSIGELSENGLMVGQVSVGANTRGYVAAVGSPPALLPLPAGDASSWAFDVNELGVIVGATSTLSSPAFGGRAARWSPDGSGNYLVEELGRLPGHSGSVATAVNNLGDVVGYSNLSFFRYPVLFSAPGGVLDLNPFGVFDPQAINDQRVFVDKQALRMHLDTMTVEDLGLPPGPPSYSATTGYAINELGHIAGTAVLATSSNCNYQATRYVDGTGWQMLTTCSPIANAYDINDQGDALYKDVLTLVDILHFEGVGDFGLQSLLDPSAFEWDVLGFGARINNARQIAVIADNPTTGQRGLALLNPTWTCQASVGYAGPGVSQLAVCGGDLSPGTQADLILWGVPVNALAIFAAGFDSAPTPVLGGTLVPVPPIALLGTTAGPAGTVVLPVVTGGGSQTLYVQAVHREPGLARGWGFSNAVRVDFLP